MAARYARALFEVAKQRDETDIVGHELSVLVTMWRQSADLREFFVRPSLPRKAKREAVVEIGQQCGRFGGVWSAAPYDYATKRYGSKSDTAGA